MNLDQFTGHTAGPWSSFETDSGNGRFTVERLGSNHLIPSRKIAVVNADKGNGDANARLIAAAPDLLEYARKLKEALEECEAYFDNRADADADQDGYIPNEEMTLLTTVTRVLNGWTP